MRVFYPHRPVENAELLPPAGPVIYLPNHLNGLLDPLVLAIVVRRRVRFLAKSTLFGNPFGRLAMRAFGCVPVYRPREFKGSVSAARAANEESFGRCRALLSNG